MSGRTETDIKWENRTKKILKESPEILNDYYYALSNKTRMTTYRYINYVKDFLKAVDVNTPEGCKGLKTNNINRYMQSLKSGQSIKASRFYAISNFFEFLIDEDYIEKNPCNRASRPKLKGNKDVVYLTKEEIEIMKNNIIKNSNGWYKTRDMAIFVLAIRTGLRVTSICEINISDIDFDNGIISVIEKGNKIREIPVSKNTMEMLNEWIKVREEMWGNYPKNDALFVANTRRRVSEKSIELMIKKNSEGINKHITPHKLRSTCATNLYENTGDIYLVADVLGHSNIQNTKRYTNIGEEKKNRVKEIMDTIA